MRLLGLLFVSLAYTAIPLRADPSSALAPPDYHAPTGPVLQDPAPPPANDPGPVDDGATADMSPPIFIPSQPVFNAADHPQSFHYSMDDLANSAHSMGPDRSDPNHHTMSEIDGL